MFCWVYPVPPSIILIEVIEPFSSTGVTTAPTPSPVISILGGDRYCLPEFNTKTSTT